MFKLFAAKSGSKLVGTATEPAPCAIKMLVAVSNSQGYCSPTISHQQYPMSIMTVCLLPGLLSNVHGQLASGGQVARPQLPSTPARTLDIHERKLCYPPIWRQALFPQQADTSPYLSERQ